jgi:hypothetical protein
VQTTPSRPEGEEPASDGPMARPHRSYVCMAREGIANGESDPEAVPEAVATVAISTIEGALMMSKLYGTPTKFTCR